MKAYILQVIESERGWGQTPDGYLAFLSEAAAEEFLKKDEKKKSKSKEVPDYYVLYHKIGYKEVKQSFKKKLNKLTMLGFDHLTELQ